ncbi:MAG: hypothetical protein ACRDUV_08980 [Pseudonocardiaceae bacterium]
MYWARTLRIPAELLWFKLPDEKCQLATGEPPSPDALPAPDTSDDPERDPVLSAPWNHRGTVKVAVVLSGGDNRVKRRMFLSLTGPALTAPAHQWLVHEPEPLIAGLAGRRVSGELVSQLSTMVADLRKMDDVAGGGSVLTMAQQAFAWVTGLLDRARYDEHTGRALHIALAELGQLCGWSAYDAGDYGLAQRYYVAGLRAAHSADDRPLGAHILAGMTYQAACQGQPAEGVTLIETALAGTRGRATPTLLAELHIWQALAFATLRDTSACTAAISQARIQAEQLKPDDDPPWLYWLDPPTITGMAGNCLLEIGRPDQAAVMLNEVIAQLSVPFVRNQWYFVTRLADALARPGKQRDLDAAAGLGMQSIDLAESLDSHTVGRLRDLCFQMQPHGTVPAVRDFLERAQGLVGG